MRYFYSFLFYIALPIIFFRLFIKSFKQPNYRKRFAERLGFYPFKLEKCLWVHAVSVGETLAAIPLIKELQQRYPQLPLLVTTMTPTGTERVKIAFKDSVQHVYIPYDIPGAVQRFLDAMQPIACIIMETELWPNMLFYCKKRQIPTCLVNARLSAKSAKGYQRIQQLTQEMLQNITAIAAHGLPDAERLIKLGADENRIEVTGNLKFDINISAELVSKGAELRTALGKTRFIWIAASTHAGEEEIILAAHKKLLLAHPSALLILVPRHPDRFDAMANLAATQFKIARRSLKENCEATTEVYVGDTMGELLLLYSAADVAFVGGSLIQRGGHNILEPAALGKAILSGPHVFNFAEITKLFVDEQALMTVTNAETLEKSLLELIENLELRQKMEHKAMQVVAANRGALAKQLALIARTIG